MGHIELNKVSAMSLDKKRIAMEIAKGKKPIEVSMEFGVSPSYISQLNSEQSFIELVETCREVISIVSEDGSEEAIKEELRKKKDETWDEVEELAIIALKDKLALGIAMKTSELLSIAAVANKALRRTESYRMNVPDQGAAVVQLNVGNVLINKGTILQTTLNAQNQVVAVGEQTIVNASKENIYSRLEGLKNERLNRLQAGKVPKFAELEAGLTAEDM